MYTENLCIRIILNLNIVTVYIMSSFEDCMKIIHSFYFDFSEILLNCDDWKHLSIHIMVLCLFGFIASDQCCLWCDVARFALVAPTPCDLRQYAHYTGVGRKDVRP